MRLGYQDTIGLLDDLVETEGIEIVLEPGSRALTWKDHEGEHKLNLPLVFPVTKQGESATSYIQRLTDEPPKYVIVLMRAGSASLGYYESGELKAHRVIRKYMVRKSQGSMQLSYLNKKGKSRAGSRIRLRESLEFFEEINQLLTDWFDELGEPELVLHSCPVRLWSYWFASRVKAPLTEDDPKLVHVPHHVHQPNHEELLRVNRLVVSATLDQALDSPALIK